MNEFSEPLKLRVKRRANFTCCWCLDRKQKVEVHHIVPRAKRGKNTEDNAAPLCSNCHTLLGGNPDYRKEIKARRDHWYEMCARTNEFVWPTGLNNPLLDFYEEISPLVEKTTGGTTVVDGTARIQLTDKDPSARDGIALLSLSVAFDNSIFPPPRNLRLIASMPFGVSISTEVQAEDDWMINGFMNVLRNKLDLWGLRGQPIEDNDLNPHQRSRDYFILTRKSTGENELSIGVHAHSNAQIGIRAYFSNRVALGLADYLDSVGFTKPFKKQSLK